VNKASPSVVHCLSQERNQRLPSISTMPPATGFQYTPPSYLARASDTTNRPWSKTDDVGGDDNEYTGDNEYDLPQEDRPQTRRESHLDAHFQQRVRNKQSRYRTILSGEADLPEHSTPEDDEEDDSILAAARNADSFADVHSARLNVESASSNQQARKTRKERITGVSSPKRSSGTASDAENARNLRAQRLRSSLLKQTPDEWDVQMNLEMRRLARKDEEAAARRAERDALSNDPTFKNDTISSRKDLEKKRLAFEAEREAMALAKEEAAVALLRAAELNEERIRQRDRDQRRYEEERLSRRERGFKKKTSKKNAKNREKSIQTKNYSGNSSTNTDGDTFMTDFDAENDFAFLNDLTSMVRDSGILKTCASCFGDPNGIEDDANSFLKSKCSAISKVFVPDLSPSSDTSASDAEDADDAARMSHSESIRRTGEYAKYRE